MHNRPQWYTILDERRLATPALIVYPERVKHNINLLKSSIDEVQRLRVHVKTHKSMAASQLLLAAGIKKFKCATIAEAEMLGQCEAPDVLLAYQPVGPNLHRFVALIQAYPHTSFSCLIDDADMATALSAALVKAGLEAGIYIDLNIGMNRTGIRPGNAALQLYLTCTHLDGMKVKGLHAYDGHLHQADLQLREQACDAAFAPVRQLQADIIAQGLPEPAVVAGGSPTYPIHARRPQVECSPGTFIYWDWGYSSQLPEQAYLPAALIATRIVSIPTPTTVCLDAGHKAIGSENDLNKRIKFLNDPDLQPVAHSEEHLIAATEKPHSYQIGDVLYGLPWHICPTVALYDNAVIAEQGNITGEWETTARKRKIIV